jgi:hypothetical protein
LDGAKRKNTKLGPNFEFGAKPKLGYFFTPFELLSTSKKAWMDPKKTPNFHPISNLEPSPSSAYVLLHPNFSRHHDKLGWNPKTKKINLKPGSKFGVGSKVRIFFAPYKLLLALRKTQME